MKSTFFKQLHALELIGDVQIIVSQGMDNQLIVSVMLHNKLCGDTAKHSIPPLTLKGTAEELDNGFFEKITEPMQTVSGLQVDMFAFTKQLEEAKKQSAMEKAQADKAQKELDAKTKKYQSGMDKAAELEAAGKYREAWMKVPDVQDYPEKAEEIRKRKKELSDKFSSPGLFAGKSE